MRVLVTGAFGNLGFATVQELLRQGHEVRCFDLDLPKYRRRARKLSQRAKLGQSGIKRQSLAIICQNIGQHRADDSA